MTPKEVIYYELLVLRCRRKEKQAFEQLIAVFEQQLLYYIRRLVDNEADALNILQNTWLGVINSIDSLRDARSLAPWLYSIARKKCISHLRKLSSDKLLFESPEMFVNAPIFNEVLQFENAQQIHWGLSKLSLPHREVLTLYFLQDLSIEEIASVLDKSTGTVKSRMHYARLALKTILEKENI